MKYVERLENLAGEIYTFSQVIAENHSASLKPNKTAATRARKATLALEKACREYRKLSIEAFKNEKGNTEETDA